MAKPIPDAAHGCFHVTDDKIEAWGTLAGFSLHHPDTLEGEDDGNGSHCIFEWFEPDEPSYSTLLECIQEARERCPQTFPDMQGAERKLYDADKDLNRAALHMEDGPEQEAAKYRAEEIWDHWLARLGIDAFHVSQEHGPTREYYERIMAKFNDRDNEPTNTNPWPLIDSLKAEMKDNEEALIEANRRRTMALTKLDEIESKLVDGIAEWVEHVRHINSDEGNVAGEKPCGFCDLRIDLDWPNSKGE